MAGNCNPPSCGDGAKTFGVGVGGGVAGFGAGFGIGALCSFTTVEALSLGVALFGPGFLIGAAAYVVYLKTCPEKRCSNPEQEEQEHLYRPQV